MSATREVAGICQGHSAAVNIACGFIPDHVRIFNLTKKRRGEWFNLAYTGASAGVSHKDGYAFVTSSTGLTTHATVNGITAYSGGDKADGTRVYQKGLPTDRITTVSTISNGYVASGTYTSAGFKIGTHAGLNNNNDVLLWHAIKFF